MRVTNSATYLPANILPLIHARNYDSSLSDYLYITLNTSGHIFELFCTSTKICAGVLLKQLCSLLSKEHVVSFP